MTNCLKDQNLTPSKIFLTRRLLGLPKATKTMTSSKILIVGGTGYIGSHIVKASIKLGHPTYVYSRPNSPKTDLLNQFQSLGVICIKGELDDHYKLVEVLRKVDVVISALAYPQLYDQLKIIEAIEVVGNIKRFLPSDFGCEEDTVSDVLGPFQTILDGKKSIRRAIEAAGIPHTFMATNCFGAYFVNFLLHPHDNEDYVTIYGTGEAKVVFNAEEDVATYTLKAATDPRTLNCSVIYMPPANVTSQNELVSLWEEKTGRCFKRVHIPEEQLVTLCQTLASPENLKVSVLHSVFVKGVTVNFDIRKDDLEASELFPDVEITTVDRLLDVFLSPNAPKPWNTPFA